MPSSHFKTLFFPIPWITQGIIPPLFVKGWKDKVLFTFVVGDWSQSLRSAGFFTKSWSKAKRRKEKRAGWQIFKKDLTEIGNCAWKAFGTQGMRARVTMVNKLLLMKYSIRGLQPPTQAFLGERTAWEARGRGREIDVKGAG